MPPLLSDSQQSTGHSLPFWHAHAERVEVDMLYDDKEFRLRVRDDGKGIDPVVLASHGIEGHYGLRGMPERAALMGGKLAVWSEVGAGPEVELRLPGSAVSAASRRGSWLSRLFASKTPAWRRSTHEHRFQGGGVQRVRSRTPQNHC